MKHNHQYQLNPQVSQFISSRLNTTSPIDSPTILNVNQHIHIPTHISINSYTSSISSMTMEKERKRKETNLTNF